MTDPIEMLRRAHGERLAYEIQATNAARDSARRWRLVALVALALGAVAAAGWGRAFGV